MRLTYPKFSTREERAEIKAQFVAQKKQQADLKIIAAEVHRQAAALNRQTATHKEHLDTLRRERVKRHRAKLKKRQRDLKRNGPPHIKKWAILNKYFQGRNILELTKNEKLQYAEYSKQWERDKHREAKRRNRAADPEKYLEYQRKAYRKNAEYYRAKNGARKDQLRPERIINRVLKCFDAESLTTGELSDRVNEAIELCLTGIDEKIPGENLGE